MRPMEETKTILHFENDPKRINAIEEIDIMKATTSDHMLNFIQKNGPLYNILQPLHDQAATSTDSCLRCIMQNFNEEFVLF